MGRLFWKIFLGFWLTLMLVAGGVGWLVHYHFQREVSSLQEVAVGPRAGYRVSTAAIALQYGGEPAIKALIHEEPPHMRARPVLIVDAQGQDLLGRLVPQGALARVRQLQDERHDVPGVQSVQAPDGSRYVLFIPAEVAAEPRRHPPRRDPMPLGLIVISVASLLFSAGMAWYLTQPVRHLQRATGQLAEGALDTRVMPSIGRRRDEIADLGRDFDHMAGRLQLLLEAQKRLLHAVSHELRSPLARLQVAVALARQQPDKVELALERIERESQRLDELVSHVLTLSRLESGMQSWPMEAVDVGEVLEDVVADARFEAESLGRRVTLSIGADVTLTARSEWLRGAFENVIRNALKYTVDARPVEVVMRTDTAADECVVSVCDGGTGVAPDQLEEMFKPFVRVGGEATGALQGYGLGLAIAKKAIEALGGTISAANRPEGGLCITMRLPIGMRS
ncbi:MAG: ATP-binding protein [Gammaproteobacteria bacterium]